MIQDDLSPIDEELRRIAIRADNACGSSYQICNECGQKGKGFTNLMEGTFTCIRCYLKKKAEELDSDPEWIRKERVYKIREAREKYNERYKNGIQRDDEQGNNV